MGTPRCRHLQASLILAPLILASCATAQQAAPVETAPSSEHAAIVKWAPRGGVNICDMPRHNTSGCPAYRGKLQVLDWQKDFIGRVIWRVETGEKSGYINDLAHEMLVEKDPGTLADDLAALKRTALAAAKAKCDRLGGVSIGMARAQVLRSCWGKPQSINTTITAAGTREQFVYGLGSYVYIDNGRVVAIQQ
jgi:hypothetical protein